MADTQELKLLITGDASSAVAAAQQTGDATKKLKVDTSDLSDETKKSLGLIPQTTDLTQKNTAVVRESSISHRELKESIREVSRGYPELGDAARAALNPLVASSFAIAEAMTIWGERLQTATELLGGIELPDFTTHARGVSAAATEYEKLQTALAGADTEFDNAATAFERQSTAISAQLSATKQLITAQREKAIADLDIARSTGAITPGQYDARRMMVEQGASDAAIRAEMTARQNDLIARQNEQAGLSQQSQAEAAKAAAIQPGMNDAALAELIKKVTGAADEAGKKADEFRKEAQHAQEVAERSQGGGGLPMLADTVQNIPGDVAFFAKYGMTADPENVKKMNEAAAKSQEETQAGLAEQAAQLQKQLDERKKHTDTAASLAAQAEKTRLELQGADDPNKVGSVAWQNAQAAAALRTRDTAGTETRFARDVDNFNKDAEEYKRNTGRVDPDSLRKATSAMSDMASLVNDAIQAMQMLAARGDDIRTMRQEVDMLQKQMRNIGNFYK